MTDIVIVVDASNGFCHPEGAVVKRACFTEERKDRLQKTVTRIKSFLDAVTTRGVPLLYLSVNERFRGTGLNWHAQIHKDLAPQNGRTVFWRDDPSDDPFASEPKLLRKIRRSAHPRIVLCGFYANKCVASVAMHVAERGIPLSIVTDCVYPSCTKRMEVWYTAYLARRWPKPIDTSLISFGTGAMHSAEWETKT